MKNSCLAVLIVCLTLAAHAEQVAEPGSTTAEAITAVLHRQQKHWNVGDIEAFVDDYWRSPELTFSSGGTTRRGFEATRERYLTSYPTPAGMGRLTFSDLEITPLGETSAMVLGRWQLKRADGEAIETIGGNFTLVFRQIDGRWLIIHDHTSRTPPDKTPTP